MNSMYDLMRKTALDYPKVFAIRFMGKCIRYSQLLQEVDVMASFLIKQGLKNGDTVTVALPNIPNAVVALYAINKLGMKANIVHPLVPKNQLLEYMKNTNSTFIFMLSLNYDKLFNINAKAVVCHISDYLPKIKGLAFDILNKKALKLIKYNENRIKYKSAIKTHLCDIDSCHDDMDCSIFLHSGGTTGVPKTVMLNNFAINSLASIGKQIVCSEDVIGKGMLAVLPIFHGFGLAMCLHTMFVNGCTSVMFPRFDVKGIAKSIRRGEVHFMAGVPTMYDKLILSKAFSSNSVKVLEFAFCGGDSMPKPLKERFDAVIEKFGGKCRLLEGYGLTETTTVVSVNNYENQKLGSVGKALPNVEFMVVDAESKKKLEIGESGEICVSGATIMLGYLNDADTTAIAMFKDERGRDWVSTGDYGYVDEDGYVFFRQRLKRIIKVSGVAVFPSEIEDCALKLDIIESVCAIGVPHEKTGSTVKLYVQLKAGKTQVSAKEKILCHIKENVISWAVPRYIEFMDKLPLTQIGKVDSKALLELHENSKTIS